MRDIRLLIAGDGELFLARAAARLREEGFDVDTVSGGEDELLPKIRSALSRARPAGISGSDAVEAFMARTLDNVVRSVGDLVTLNRSLRGDETPSNSCQAMNCARGLQLRAALKETIDVLEQTKSAFKSKTLANLRQKLELLLEQG